MPLYDPSTREGREETSRIVRIKLDGHVIFQPGRPDSENTYVKAADTDEGWVDVYETEVVDGKRRLKMGPWYDAEGRLYANSEVESTLKGFSLPALKRDFVVKRIHGKVEVLFE